MRLRCIKKLRFGRIFIKFVETLWNFIIKHVQFQMTFTLSRKNFSIASSGTVIGKDQLRKVDNIMFQRPPSLLTIYGYFLVLGKASWNADGALWK